MERAVEEVFELNGVKVVVKEDEDGSCGKCVLRDRLGCDTKSKSDLVCAADDRRDEKDVVFVKVEEKKDDNINLSHYKTGGIETIDYMKAKLGDGFEHYLAGNVIKYISRYKHKNGLEDCKKAAWYINKLIETLEESE